MPSRVVCVGWSVDVWFVGVGWLLVVQVVLVGVGWLFVVVLVELFSFKREDDVFTAPAASVGVNTDPR